MTTLENPDHVPAAEVAALSDLLSGALLTPSSAGYDEARSVWNAMIDRRPASGVRRSSRGAERGRPRRQRCQVGGAQGRVSDDATAYQGRSAAYVMNVHGRWSDPAQDEAVDRVVPEPLERARASCHR